MSQANDRTTSMITELKQHIIYLQSGIDKFKFKQSNLDILNSAPFITNKDKKQKSAKNNIKRQIINLEEENTIQINGYRTSDESTEKVKDPTYDKKVHPTYDKK